MTYRLRFWVTLSLVLCARSALASDVSDEASAGTTLTSADTPKTTFLSNRLGGSWDALDELSLSLDAIWTRYDGHSEAAPDDVFNFLLAADWDAAEHWSFGAELHGSPRSSTEQNVPVRFGRLGQRGTATVAGESWSYGGSLSAEYDTAGDSDFESNIALDVGATEFDSSQRLSSLETAAGRNFNTTLLEEYCATHFCRRALRNILQGEAASPLQGRITLDLTETLYRNTDLEVTGNYYLYSSEPDRTGYYGVASLGRTLLGDGFPFEPPRYALRTTAVERLGITRSSLFAQYSRYASEDGYALLFGAKFQLTFARQLKTWLFADLQRDVPQSAEPFMTVWGGIGARLGL